jgi:pyruvate-formate lyase-activating enzyme
VTRQPFTARVERAKTFKLASINTTEVCNLSCVMCHFNGPKATKKSASIAPELVRKLLASRPRGEKVWFVATGDFFNDPHYLDHLRAAREFGLEPRVITHGQSLTPAVADTVLEIGVRDFLFSVDSIDSRRYAKIRRGGRLETVLDACEYLRGKKTEYPGLTTGVSVICLPNQQHSRAQVEEFWRARVDSVQFVSEYHDIFHFRRVFGLPEKRTPCRISMIPLPSGRVAPCCAMAVYSHDEDVSWLPHLAGNTPEEIYQKLCDLYDDPESPLGRLCSKCDWWIQFQPDGQGRSMLNRRVVFDSSNAQKAA